MNQKWLPILGILFATTITALVRAGELPAATQPAATQTVRGHEGAVFIRELRAGRKVTLVTMGTSLTAGAWRWPDVMMSDWLNKDFPGQVTFFNEAVSGSASSQGPGNNRALSGLAKLPAVIAHKPDVVFIEFSTNDAFLPYNITPEESKKNLNTMIDGILAANPHAEIILQTMNSCTGKSGAERPQLQTYVQGYRDVAQARGLLLVDHYPNWLRLMTDSPATFARLVPDGIHPRADGYRQILLPQLKETLLGDQAADKPVSAAPADPQKGMERRHIEKLAAEKKEKFDLFMIGDSITHSIGELGGKYEPLKAVWQRHYGSRHGLNLGFNGARTENILWNLQNGQLDGQSPKVAVLLIGTNDADDRHFPVVHTPEQICAGTKALVDIIRQKCPDTKILILRIFPRGGEDEKGVGGGVFHSSVKCIQTVRRAGELTAGLADGKQVFRLDINHVFLRPDGTINSDLMPDLLHPNQAGAEAWAQAIEPTLARLMGDQPIVDEQPNSALVPVPKLEKDSYDWYARHDDVMRVKDSINPEIVLIGDSITHFWAGEPRAAIAHGPRAWESAFGKYRTLNLGFGWDRTQNVLWRLDHGELDGLHPRVIILNIGTNNTSKTANARQNTPAEIVAGIREILLRLRAKTPEAKIILMAVFPREQSPGQPRRAQISEINKLLEELAKTSRVTFLDIGPKLLEPDGTISRKMMSDFCHPTEKGYQVWADALEPLLAQR